MSRIFAVRTPDPDWLVRRMMFGHYERPVGIRNEGWHKPLTHTGYHYFQGQVALCGYRQPSRLMSEDYEPWGGVEPKCLRCSRKRVSSE